MGYILASTLETGGVLELTYAQLLTSFQNNAVPTDQPLRITERPSGEPDVYGTFDQQTSAVSEGARVEGLAGLYSYQLTTDTAIPIGGGGGGLEAFSVTPTTTVGGFKAGIPFTSSSDEERWRHLLVEYQVPQGNGFTLAGLGSRAVQEGQAFNSAQVTATWSFTNPENVATNSVVIRDVTAGVVLAQNIPNNGATSVSLPTYTAGYGPARKFSVSVNSTQQQTITQELTITGLPALYYGSNGYTHEQLLPLLQNGGFLNATRLAELSLDVRLQDGKAVNNNYVCTGGKYIHVLWDQRFGQEPGFGDVRSGVNTFTAFDVSSVSVLDVFGILRQFRLLSTYIQFGSAVNLNILI